MNVQILMFNQTFKIILDNDDDGFDEFMDSIEDEEEADDDDEMDETA